MFLLPSGEAVDERLEVPHHLICLNIARDLHKLSKLHTCDLSVVDLSLSPALECRRPITVLGAPQRTLRHFRAIDESLKHR